MKKHTRRDKLNAIIDYMCGEEIDIGLQELVDFCQSEIDRVNNITELKIDDATRKIMAALDDQFRTADVIHDTIDDDSITIGKVRNRLSALVREGYAKKQEMKIPATEDRKARTAMCYAKVKDVE